LNSGAAETYTEAANMAAIPKYFDKCDRSWESFYEARDWQRGVHYIGHMTVNDDGEEVEAFQAVRCRRCRQYYALAR
jgi:hypothetical protein